MGGVEGGGGCGADRQKDGERKGHGHGSGKTDRSDAISIKHKLQNDQKFRYIIRTPTDDRCTSKQIV